jgi:hypothetical protein
VSRSSAAWLVSVSEDAWLSTFTSPESIQELQRWDKTVTNNWIPCNWGEKMGYKNKHCTGLDLPLTNKTKNAYEIYSTLVDTNPIPV